MMRLITERRSKQPGPEHQHDQGAHCGVTTRGRQHITCSPPCTQGGGRIGKQPYVRGHSHHSLNTCHLVKKTQQRLIFPRSHKWDGLPLSLLQTSTEPQQKASSVSVCQYSMAAARNKTESTWLGQWEQHRGLWEILSRTWTQCMLTVSKRRPAALLQTPPTQVINCLPFGRRYRTIKTRTIRLRDSYFPGALNSITPPYLAYRHTYTPHALKGRYMCWTTALCNT